MSKQKKPQKKPQTLNVKILNFLSFHWWLMSGLYALALVYTIYFYYDMKSQITMTNELLEQHVNSAVPMTVDGRSKDSIQTALTPDTKEYKSMIKRIIVDYLIVDMVMVTNGFSIKTIKSEDKLYYSLEKMRYFAENYLDNSVSTRNIFKAYMTYLLSTINNKNLPEYIVPYASSILKYKAYEGGTWEIEVTIQFEVNAYYTEEASYLDKNGEAVFSAVGYFDLKQATVNNPMGIKFTTFSIPKIEKRTET